MKHMSFFHVFSAKMLASCSLGSGACSGARPVSCSKPWVLLNDPKPSWPMDSLKRMDATCWNLLGPHPHALLPVLEFSQVNRKIMKKMMTHIEKNTIMTHRKTMQNSWHMMKHKATKTYRNHQCPGCPAPNQAPIRVDPKLPPRWL